MLRVNLFVSRLGLIPFLATVLAAQPIVAQTAPKSGTVLFPSVRSFYKTGGTFKFKQAKTSRLAKGPALKMKPA
jgi:hypothetical protein